GPRPRLRPRAAAGPLPRRARPPRLRPVVARLPQPGAQLLPVGPLGQRLHARPRQAAPHALPVVPPRLGPGEVRAARERLDEHRRRPGGRGRHDAGGPRRGLRLRAAGPFRAARGGGAPLAPPAHLRADPRGVGASWRAAITRQGARYRPTPRRGARGRPPWRRAPWPAPRPRPARRDIAWE